jgi:hypothetical protein
MAQKEPRWRRSVFRGIEIQKRHEIQIPVLGRKRQVFKEQFKTSDYLLIK